MAYQEHISRECQNEDCGRCGDPKCTYAMHRPPIEGLERWLDQFEQIDFGLPITQEKEIHRAIGHIADLLDWVKRIEAK